MVQVKEGVIGTARYNDLLAYEMSVKTTPIRSLSASLVPERMIFCRVGRTRNEDHDSYRAYSTRFEDSSEIRATPGPSPHLNAVMATVRATSCACRHLVAEFSLTLG